MPYGFRVAFVKIRRGSNMAIFTGAGVAIVTPFKEDESIDYDRLDELIDFHCENGTDSIVICGTSGEAATMTEREHMECVKFTVERTKGRIPVIAGTGSNCTKTAMELSKEAAGYGADGVLVVTPYYNKATQKGMIAHFTQVADAAKIPVVLYNIPGRTGCKMEAETVAYLVNHVDNIVAIKEASGDFSNIVKMMDLTDGKALPLIHALFSEVNPIPVKKAVELMGLCGGTVRAPLTELEPEHTEILKREMQKFGLIY